MADNELAKQGSSDVAKAQSGANRPVFTPQVDIWETENAVVLEADMPGVDENSVDVELERNELTIRGTTTLQTPEGYASSYQEYTSGSFERTFTLGTAIDRGKIKATVKDGVLHLELPKAEDAQPRRITVARG